MEENIPDPGTQVAQVEEAVASIRERTQFQPQVGLILGTGLGQLTQEIDVEYRIPYESIPHCPVSTVESHGGELLLGTLRGAPVACMKGRVHVYEGYSARQVTFPVRVMAKLGIGSLLVSNACGCMNPDYRRGDVMLLSDHINLQGVNPLVGPNVDAWGPRFPDMSEPYDVELRQYAMQAAKANSIQLHEGVYVSVLGPSLETKAEYKFLRAIGADVVGMSTTPEVTVARHMNLRVMAVSVITDECFPDTLQPLTLEDVIEAAGIAEPKLAAIMSGVVEKLAQG
ncbi:MAG: purine-nucleoside phosphorylase [Rhodothermaceae bacterium]|nr:purine-nucleoside phosphorylase [Rhodothermaceae bacterium]MXW33924.1 purine-nucleoside phosphorylase [Rhodothermaceae bacterium]MYC04081.1 purine-nucleoside phosphorylase [Rhodothermaceae bacterium]MYE61808.1 purine-nucleoside phosphorylase [Rhodothermaceae bacterium]MYI16033.1 purine-nucleoside phosphorylase [Rhodothermaceae bacterium]